MTAEERELFEYWIAHMDDALEEFSARLPSEVRGALDRTPSSLDALEAFLLERYPDPAAIRADPEPNLDGAARYVGEVYRRHIGGTWRMRDDDPSYVYAGLPELTFLPERDTPACPIRLVTTALHRRTGTFLSTVLTNQAKIIARARG
ncbi:hypothetical protein [Pseudonocardia lacus]|uniref:hypothetical protein n=1 Tax=Pseudonocardia lacus TaxID=2835865 RepID=UPI001BDDA43D|nr:hypothetical protein [Pseudonocardia lacus]